MSSDHEHFAKVTLSPMIHRTTPNSALEEMVRGMLLDQFRQIVYNKMTVHTQTNYSDDTISAVAGIVIMTTDEYRAMQRMYAMNVVTAPMHQPAPLVMKQVEKQAKEILEQEIKKSKSAEDYLTNRVRQLQNEHLLPKRRPT